MHILMVSLDFVPIAGGVKDIALGIRDGDGWMVALGVGVIILDVFTLGSASLVKGTIKTSFKVGTRAIKKGVMFRKANNVGSFSNLTVPMRRSSVKRFAKEGGVGLKNVRIKIHKSEGLLKSPFYGLANRNTIHLFPNAFKNPETLIRTLGHERTHIFQYKVYGENFVKNNSGIFEKAAYGIEDAFIRYWKN